MKQLLNNDTLYLTETQLITSNYTNSIREWLSQCFITWFNMEGNKFKIWQFALQAFLF